MFLASKFTPISSPIGLNLILCYTQHTPGHDNNPSHATGIPIQPHVSQNPYLFLCMSPRSHTTTPFLRSLI